MQNYNTRDENDYFGGWNSWWWWPVPTGADTASKVFEVRNIFNGRKYGAHI